MKKKIAAVFTALALALGVFAPAAALLENTVMADDPTFPVYLTVAADPSSEGMPTGLAITDSSYDRYFADGALFGANIILGEGNLYVNGIAVPKTLAEYKEKGFKINGKELIINATDEMDYRYEAIEAITDAVPIGSPVTLKGENGKCSRIEYMVYKAFIIGRIKGNSVVRSYADGIKPYDENDFSSLTAVDFGGKTFSDGEMALAYVNAGGTWTLVKAVELKGRLIDAADHASYQMRVGGGLVTIPDAMGFSRDNIIISNRCGEFANAMKYFGFTGLEGEEVSLWVVPSGQDGVYGAPAGFTSVGNAQDMLKKAIAIAESKLYGVEPETEELKENGKYVSSDVYEEVSEAISAAKAACDDYNTADEILNYRMYILYLTLNGSADDVGAQFAGYSYTGLDKAVWYAVPRVVNENGKLVFYNYKGQQDETFTGFADGEDAAWYIIDGQVAAGFNGLVPGNYNGTYGWWYVLGGKLQQSFSGLVQNEIGWWYVENGYIDFAHGTANAPIIVHNENGWWAVSGSRVNFSYKGFAENENGMWYLENGKVNFSTGTENAPALIQNGSEWLAVIGGKVRYDYTGLVQNNIGWWYVKDGRVAFDQGSRDCPIVIGNSNGWWAVVSGKVDFNFTGLGRNDNGWWRLENGKVNFNANGLFDNINGKWKVSGGKVDFGYTGLYSMDGEEFWYIKGGHFESGFTGIITGQHGDWLVVKGKVNFGFSGVYMDPATGKTYTIIKGQVK